MCNTTTLAIEYPKASKACELDITYFTLLPYEEDGVVLTGKVVTEDEARLAVVLYEV